MKCLRPQHFYVNSDFTLVLAYCIRKQAYCGRSTHHRPTSAVVEYGLTLCWVVCVDMVYMVCGLYKRSKKTPKFSARIYRG